MTGKMTRTNESHNRIMVKLIAFAMVAAVCMSMAIPAQAAKLNAAAYAAVFNATYYYNNNPDLQTALGNNEQALLNHFVNYGMKEGRQASEEFNVQAYRNRYPDLQAAFGNDLKSYYMHYINNGKAEGRDGRVQAANTQAAAQTASAAPAAATATTTTTTASNAEQVIALVNADRAANGLSSVSSTPQLMQAAQARAQELATSFSHTRPNGTSCFTIFQTYNVSYRTAGENIAAGQSTPASVETAWMNSTGHRANILNSSFGHIGVGCYTCAGGYGIYWVQMFTN